MTKTMSAAEARTQIEKDAEAKNRPEIRDLSKLEIPGDWARQGDVSLILVPADHPRGKLRGERQVAVGTSVGSRHVAEGAVVLYEGVDAAIDAVQRLGHKNRLVRPQVGPVIVVSGPWALTHPEHAHCGNDVATPEAPRTYQVAYQLDAQTQRAVQD